MSRFPTPRPTVGRRIYRAHGLGNDYLVVAEGEAWRLDSEAIRMVCDRNEGVGGDGIVAVSSPESGEPYRLRMFNPDGSEFERSGNGLRVAASWLHRTGRTPTGLSYLVEVGGEVVRMETHARTSNGQFDVSVAMGRASVGEEAIRLAELSEEALAPDAPMGADGWLETAATGPLPVHIVSVGNPHCVVFLGALGDEAGLAACFSEDALRRMGPGLATHPGFANGCNVQLACIRDDGDIEIRIWERGVGPTRASGTSSCAVAVAAVASGRRPAGDVTVRMPGGLLQIHVTEGLEVTLRGPVQEVCEIDLTDGFLRNLVG